MRTIFQVSLLSFTYLTLASWSKSSADVSADNKPMKIKIMLESSIDLATKAKALLQGTGGICSSEPKDCSEILSSGQKESGVYKIWPANRLNLKCTEVFCDMDTDGGGWTVIQRRGDFSRAKDYFFNDWETYKKGFGDVSQDFWIGNDLIFALTNQQQNSLRIDLKDLEKEKRYAAYDKFWIDSEDYNYTLHVSGYTGSAGDAFTPHSGRQFTTKDRDNDLYLSSNCANDYKGAWWYTACHSSNLNGLYLNGTHATYADGIEWSQWRGQNYSFPFVEMKIRQIFFEKENPHEILSELTPQ